MVSTTESTGGMSFGGKEENLTQCPFGARCRLGPRLAFPVHVLDRMTGDGGGMGGIAATASTHRLLALHDQLVELVELADDRLPLP